MRRLRSASALVQLRCLPQKPDSGTRIFQDVGVLYDLRSALVHGGQLKRSYLRNRVGKISEVPDGEVDKAFGVSIARAVDRLRDIVRRSILARLCLAYGDEPLWPFGKDVPVDALLADDATRVRWRTQWQQVMRDIDAADSIDAPTSVVEFI
jgi:hypothetical protein